MYHLAFSATLSVDGCRVVDGNGAFAARELRHLKDIDLVRDDVQFLLLVPVPFVNLTLLETCLLGDELHMVVAPMRILEQLLLKELDLSLRFSLSCRVFFLFLLAWFGLFLLKSRFLLRCVVLTV